MLFFAKLKFNREELSRIRNGRIKESYLVPNRTYINCKKAAIMAAFCLKYKKDKDKR